MSVFTPSQRAELVDAVARARIEYAAEKAARAKADYIQRHPPKPRKKRPRKTLPAKSDPMWKPTRAEEKLADRLMEHIAADSVIDRRRHALGVARMIVQGRRR